MLVVLVVVIKPIIHKIIKVIGNFRMVPFHKTFSIIIDISTKPSIMVMNAIPLYRYNFITVVYGYQHNLARL